MGSGRRNTPENSPPFAFTFKVQGNVEKRIFDDMMAMVKDKYCSVLNRLDPAIEVKLESHIVPV